MKNIIGDTMSAKKRLAKRNEITGEKDKPITLLIFTLLVGVVAFYLWVLIAWAI